MVDILNVSKVHQSGLCMGCGICESICPVQAIRIKRDNRKGIFFSVVDNDRCTDCGLCVEVCPGEAVDFDRLSKKFLDGKSSGNILGSFEFCYFAHASDNDIRYHSASGGLVTALLIHALENGVIDAALVTRFSAENPLLPETIIAETREQIIAACGSKYCPTTIGTALREIVEREGRFAVVGLPCQIHGIRKFEEVNSRLQRKIILHFGLFCANNNTFLGTEYLLRQNGICPEDVREIRYRGEGWPGKVCVTLCDNTRRIIPRGTTEKRWYRKAFFSSAAHYDFMIPRCLLCPDQTCELADISFGDPWLREFKQSERIGKSLLIVRTRIGTKLLTEAMEAGAVVLEEAPVSMVKRAQNYVFKTGVGGRIYLRQILRLATPDYGKRDLSFTTRDIQSAFRYLPSYFSYCRWSWPFLRFFAVVYYAGRIVRRGIVSMLRFCLRRFGSRKHNRPA